MEDIKLNWDWDTDEFRPPFTILYGKGLEFWEGTSRLVPKEFSHDVSIMARANDPRINADTVLGKWFVVTAYNVPKGQRRATAQSLKLLCEMKWSEYSNNLQSTQENQS
jgi:hypothetical protein